MAYHEKTTSSYGNRLGKAFKGIVGGCIAFVVGTVILFWNEGNFVKTKNALNEAQDVTVQCDSVDTLDATLNNKLIHATAIATTEDMLEDGAFGVIENAISLRREVAYYQWIESSNTQTRDKLGGGQETTTTYTYDKEWQSNPINSANFHDPAYKDANFTLVTTKDTTQYAKRVAFGAYTLPPFFIESIHGEVPAESTLTPSELAVWEEAVLKNPHVTVGDSATNSVTEPKWVHVSGNIVYFGRSLNTPQVGDVRVTLTKVPSSQEISILAKVNGGTFEKFTAKSGKTVSLLHAGRVSMGDMYASAHAGNKMRVWVLRGLGIILVCAGLKMIFSLLEAIAKVVPFLGSIVGAGVGLICSVLGFAWSLIWIAIAWLTYRPLVGIPLIIAAIVLVLYLRQQAAKKKSSLETPAQ